MLFKNLCVLVFWTKAASALKGLTLPMLRLLLSKAQGLKAYWKPFKPCHVGIHWIAFTECSQMSTHVPGFQYFFQFFCILFVLDKLAPSSMRVKVSQNQAISKELWSMNGLVNFINPKDSIPIEHSLQTFTGTFFQQILDNWFKTNIFICVINLKQDLVSENEC